MNGCSTIGGGENSFLKIARLGCNLSSIKGFCRKGIDYFIERNENENFIALGDVVVISDKNTVSDWKSDEKCGQFIIHSIIPTGFEGATKYDLTYTFTTNEGKIELYQEVSMLAITTEEGVRYLWKNQNIQDRSN